MEKVVTVHELLGVDKNMDYRDLAMRLYMQVNDLAEELSAHGIKPEEYCQQVPAKDCGDCKYGRNSSWCWVVASGKAVDAALEAGA